MLSPKEIIAQQSGDYLHRLAVLNNFSVKLWQTLPGMEFGSMQKWWKQDSLRDIKHNGLDLCSFINTSKKCINLNSSTKISIILDGTVLYIQRDFLGYSVFFSHEVKFDNMQLFSVLGHLKKPESVSVGQQVSANDYLSTLAPTQSINIQPHLHISFFTINVDSVAEVEFTWESLDNDERVTFLDPSEFIGLK